MLNFPVRTSAALIVGSAGIAACAFYGLLFAQPGTASLPDGREVINYLNQSIDWHRQITVEEQVATDAADVIYLEDDRQNANVILGLSFDFARADAQLLASQGSPRGQSAGTGPNKYQSLVDAAQSADAEVRETQSELESAKKKLESARPSNRRKLSSEVEELQSELDLAQTRSTTLHNLLQFVTGASGTGSNLQSQIEELEHSVPELEAVSVKGGGRAQSSRSPSGSGIQPANRRPQPSGIIGLIEDLFSLSHKTGVIDQRIRSTDELANHSQRLRAPLIADLTNAAQQGEQAAKQADTSDPSQLEKLKLQLDALNSGFKQVSTVVLPLSKQEVLFDLYRGNLARWRSVVKSDYAADLKRLFLRLAIFGAVLAVLITLARMWRRAVFHYIHDPRRRYQFLLLRRIVVWFAVGITIAFALATEFGSMATFAGLITAGIAVALQNVIMAIAGYFFLIGKYGVKVGDRVQISGVTGDVIDIGLIRLHLLEIGDVGTDRQPTGRVVVFSNAVVFQPTASFYKQIPGTNFVWHQVSLTLAPESDYQEAEKRILGAVEKVYAAYRERIELQHREMERTLNLAVPVPKPRSQLRLTQGGLEIVIRYPVELETASEIDDRVTRELLRSLEEPPKLKLVGSGIPNIQPVAKEEKVA